MCCIAEVAMFVFGIVTLVKGSFMLSRKRVVRGAPAYVIGAILISVLPAIIVIGFVVGFIMAASAGGQPTPQQLAPLAALDAVVVFVAMIAVLVVALIYAKEPQPKKFAATPFGSSPNPTFTPADPNNPYAPPQADELR